MRAGSLTTATATLVLLTTAVAATTMPAAGPLDAPAFGAVPGAELPVARAYRYTMSGSVRPLLFWMTRNDIGLARIVWRGRHDGPRGYELLVGTEPSRAPRALNRWGFVAEEASGADGSVLALMTGSPDTTYEAEAAPPSTTGGSDFRAIHGRVSDRVAVWRLASLRTPQLLTVQQVQEALAHLRRDAGRGTVAQRSLSTGVSPGFLVAVAGLLDEAIASVRQGSESPDRRSVAYVFGSRIYELRVVSAERATTAYDGRAISTVRTRFEIRTSETGARSRFELTAGAADDLAGVPLTIEWQPHWWLRVKLRLVGPADPAGGL